MLTGYEAQAKEFLDKHNIKFKADYFSDSCPLWCDGKHIHGVLYKVTFRREEKKSLNLPFWNSYKDMTEGKEPRAYDVLASITKSNPGAYESFCSDFGYNIDSRKAEKTWKLVKREWEKVSAFFTEAEIEELQEIN